ncbi:MAG: arylesterase [Thioalkalivibrio sp.]|nr:arylesterase [Thioalkalivibrio sp.]
MFRFLITMVLALLWSVSGAGNSHDMQRILVFGDSLSAAHGIDGDAGWVSLLEMRLSQRDPPWDVRNASVGGETTAGGRSRLSDLLDDTRPDVLILQLGGNDGLRGLSLRAMRENFEAMLDAADAAGAEVLLVGIEIPPNYGPVYTDRFRSVFSDLAAERDLAFIPFLLEGVALEPGMMLDDGIHPGAEAQPRILENVWSELEPMLERLEEARPAAL